MKIIDGHAFLGKSIYMKQTAETLIATMDRVGVEATVAVAPPPGPFYDAANDYVRSACETYPGRLVPLYRVNPQLEGMEDKIETALSEQGFKGVKLDPTNDGYGVGGQLMEPVLKKAEEHGVPVYIHSGDSIFCPPESVATLASKHEEVNFVTPMTRRAPETAKNVANLYLMTRQFPALAFQWGYASHYDLDRLVFVSDAPLGSLDVELKGVEVSEMGGGVRDKIMGGNLSRIMSL
ncbi:amidohydrolase family protein [Candidatus Bathyarchaeota archaeon]|nr:amidohydrolase family protein [Candidatus Bathyarchaeota archaeon]